MKFVRVSGLGRYHFEKCEPEDVVYQLDYNQEGLSYKEEYVQMFKDCGWEYLQDFAGYSYFRKPASGMNGDEEIFCDDASRLQMMERVFKGKVLPLIILFSCVLIPQLILTLFFRKNYVLAAVQGAIILLYITIFLWFAAKYRQYRNRIKK